MTARDSEPEVLVTGATGFVGGHLAQRLLEQGRKVRLLVRTPEKLALSLRQRCSIIQGDLADSCALVRAVTGVEVVFHCAANVNTWDTWDAYYEVNVQGVQNLLDALVGCKPVVSRFVHVSTVDVYGYPSSPCNEQAVLTDAGFGYGRSKSAGEVVVRRYGMEHAIPYTIVRPTNVVGPGSQFIRRIGKELRSGMMLTIDKGRANAGLLYVDNLVNCLIWASKAAIAIGECYNVRDPYDVDWTEFIGKLKDAVAGRGLVVNLPFEVALTASKWIEWPYRYFNSGREPLLHPLIVHMFGRTCGHDASKIYVHSGIAGGVDFDAAIANSARWFLNRCTKI